MLTPPDISTPQEPRLGRQPLRMPLSVVLAILLVLLRFASPGWALPMQMISLPAGFGWADSCRTSVLETDLEFANTVGKTWQSTHFSPIYVMEESKPVFFKVAHVLWDSTTEEFSFVPADAVGERAMWLQDLENVKNQWVEAAMMTKRSNDHYFASASVAGPMTMATHASGGNWSAPVVVEATGYVGKYPSLAAVNGNPAITYYDETNGSLKFIRATNASGSAWAAPITLDTTGNVAPHAVMAVVNGYPAVAYLVAPADVRFIRATNASGTAWAAPITLDSTNTLYGADSMNALSMAIVNGNPAVAYVGFSGINFIRATNENGTTWGYRLSLTENSSCRSSISLAVVNGLPSIAYYSHDSIRHSNDLKFIHATDANGLSWGSSVTVAKQIGSNVSLAEVAGKPAITYFPTASDELTFVRAPELPPSFNIDWISMEP